jgi:hypothetical protein
VRKRPEPRRSPAWSDVNGLPKQAHEFVYQEPCALNVMPSSENGTV